MIYKKVRSLLAAGGLLLSLGLVSSCNSKDDSSEYISPVNLAVTDFSLTADSKNPGLDSVYFTIDLEHGVIFNADSLRKGTAVNKVIPKITFSNNISEAVIVMSGGTTREGEVNYKTNPTDSIDFTGEVSLRVKADNNEIGMTYAIKVNVHRMETDSLFWNEVSYREMPSRLQNPKAMKTIEIGGNVVSLVKENDGSFSKVDYESMSEMKFNVTRLDLPFNPVVETLCATEDAAWILDDSGALWKGNADLLQWDDTGEKWNALIGPYITSVVGIRQSAGAQVFSQYPEIDINPVAIPEGFPVKGFSNFVTLTNKWTSSPVAFFAGGVSADGKASDSTWAFDGREWINLSTGGIPSLEGASIIPYYHYRPSATGTSMIEYNVWMLIGGRKNDGTFNRDVYISYNNGVDWTLGTTSMQLPESVPTLDYCDNIVIDIEKSANLSDGWKTSYKNRRKLNYTVDGDIITWECPYIYLFGGYYPDGSLNTRIWRGVLGRLTFVPVI